MTRKKTTGAPTGYEVGRGKPPRSSQFKPGQSGNPGGRRRGSRNFKSIVLDVLDSEIELTENGRKRTVPVIEALVLRQVQEGLRGQLRAIESLLDRYERHVGQEVDPSDELPEEDSALLERALSFSKARHQSQRNRVPQGPSDLADGEDLEHD